MQGIDPAAEVFVPFIIGACLVMTRVLATIVMVPGFAQGTLPTRLRVMVAMGITLMIDLGLGLAWVPAPDTAMELIRMVGREVMIGVGMGLAVRIILAGVEAAGAIAGINMGLSLNVFVDPTSGEETMTLGSLMSVCAALMFIAMDGHHVVLTGIFHHLQQFPVGETQWAPPGPLAIAFMGSKLCVTALLLSAPVIVVTLLLNVALALVSRVVPSVNLFGIGLGLLTFSGMVALAFEGEALLIYVQRAVENLPNDMWRLSGMGAMES